MKNFKKNLKCLSYFYFVGLLNLIAIESLHNKPKDDQNIIEDEEEEIGIEPSESSKLILKLEKIFSNKRFEICKIAEDETCTGQTIIKLNNNFKLDNNFNAKYYEGKDVIVLEGFTPIILKKANKKNANKKKDNNDNKLNYIDDLIPLVTIDKNGRVSLTCQEVASDLKLKNNLTSDVLGKILLYSSDEDPTMIPVELPVQIRNVPWCLLNICKGDWLMAFIRPNAKEILKDNEPENAIPIINNIVVNNPPEEVSDKNLIIDVKPTEDNQKQGNPSKKQNFTTAFICRD